MEDGRCKLGLAGRLELVGLIEQGATMRAAAAALGVAPATAHRWWHRWQGASEAGAFVAVVSAGAAAGPAVAVRGGSAPGRSGGSSTRGPGRTLGRRRLAGLVGHRRSTIHKVLARHGCSRRRRSPERQTFRRYEWSQPGALLHMDTKRLQRFALAGSLGERRSDRACRQPRRRLRLRALRRRRPQPPGLRRAAQRRQRPRGHGHAGARDRMDCASRAAGRRRR